MSAAMFLLDVALPDGASLRVVARFPGEFVRSLFDDPAQHEADVLRAIRASGLPVPEVYSLGDGSDGRFLLLEYLPGRATANPEDPDAFVRSIAECLAMIHATGLADGRLDHLPLTRIQYGSSRTEFNADLREPEVLARIVALEGPTHDRLVLRHGDFWPGNILWQDGKISGVVDWENALRGPAIADLAITRLDVAWVLGFEAMEDFTAHYLSLNAIDVSNLKYWDLRAALRPMPNLEEWAGPYAHLGRPDITHEGMREVLLKFVGAALS